MIKLEDLKVGDYVGCLYVNIVDIVKKINKKSFTTATGETIYEREFKEFFVLTEEEARASIFYKCNEELKDLNNHLKYLKGSLDMLSSINANYTVNTEAIENKINDILDKIKEKLENDK